MTISQILRLFLNNRFSLQDFQKPHYLPLQMEDFDSLYSNHQSSKYSSDGLANLSEDSEQYLYS